MYASIRKISHSKFVNHLGFTLVELMVTVVVLGIIATIATPSISNQLANQRVRSTATTLENVLRDAKAQSSISKIPVTVTYSNGNQSNNTINVKVPYSGPMVFASPKRNLDWTNIFLKSAIALDTFPNSGGGSNNSGGGGNNSGGGSNNSGGGSNNSGGSSDNSGGNNSGSDSNNSGGGSNNSGGGSNNSGGSSDNSGGDSNNSGGSSNSTPENLVIIESHPYSTKSKIMSSPKSITFKPSKTVSSAVTYTVCDINNDASTRQVIVSSVGLISSKLGGSCG